VRKPAKYSRLSDVDRGFVHALRLPTFEITGLTLVDRTSSNPVFQRLNEGDAYGMGESMGVSAELGRARAQALQNVCLWCDEFMACHVGPNLLTSRAEPLSEPAGGSRPTTT
jgi:hypothetical protein